MSEHVIEDMTKPKKKNDFLMIKSNVFTIVPL